MKLSIVNLMKPDSLYNAGMRPFVFSRRRYERENVGWHRDGEAMRYFKNGYVRASRGSNQQVRENLAKMPASNFVEINQADLNCSGVDTYYYTFHFSYTFKHEDDTVFFAHCVPYSYN